MTDDSTRRDEADGDQDTASESDERRSRGADGDDPDLPERRAVRERRRHGGPSPERSETPREGGSKVDSGKGLGQVDKREHVPGKEPGDRPQDAGTNTDSGSRRN